MTRHQTQRTIGRTWLALSLGLAIAGGALATASASSGTVPEKTKKQIRVMEGMLDSILLDSPNLLVAGSHVTHGVYLDEFGVVLSFEASLTGGGGFDFGRSLEFLKNIRIQTDKDKTIIWHEGSGEDSTGLSSEKEKEIQEKVKEAEEKAKEAQHKAQELIDKNKVIVVRPGAAGEEDAATAKETYEKGKQELIDALVDYGETLTSLRDDQWVAVAAFLKDNQFFTDQKMSRLVIKARVRDLRGDLSRDALLGRIVMEEY